jgi:glycine cleavage system aminomethyltransferase T
VLEIGPDHNAHNPVLRRLKSPDTASDAYWNIMLEAGAPYDIGPGNPSPIERIESGLLSYGGDNDDNTNPFEVRLGKYVDLHLHDEVVGIKALHELHTAGMKRHQLGIKLDNQSPKRDIFGGSSCIKKAHMLGK